MALRLTFLVSAAILLPAAAVAQPAKPATPPQSTAPGQTGTTPGQEQTAPGQASDLTPAATGQTPSGQTTAKGQAQSKPGKADLKAGAMVFDSNGDAVGKIDSVNGKDATLDTGKVKVKVPTSSISRNDKGLLFGMSKAEVEAAANKQKSDE